MKSNTLKKLLTFTMAMLLAFCSGISYEVLAEEVTEETLEETSEENSEDIVLEEVVEEEVIEEVAMNTVVDTIQEESVEIVETVIEEQVQEVVVQNAMARKPRVVEQGISSISSNEQSIRGFVVRLYRNVLGREADEQGFNYWVSGLENKTITGASAAKGFFLSNEMNRKNLSNTDYVKTLYLTILNRKSDTDGLKYWVKLLEQNMSREYVVNGFVNSNEFGKLCEKYKVSKGNVTTTKNYRDQNQNVTAFVNRMYSKVLNRSSDVSGLEHWTKNLINKKETGATLVKGFFLSKEFLSKNMTDEEFLKVAYAAILNRTPDTSGKKHWLAVLGDHKSRSSVLKGFVNSAEFKSLCKSYNIAVGDFGKTDMFKTVKSVNVSYLSQDDPRWKNTYYGGYTFGDTGCAETVLTMIFRAHGTNVVPTAIATYLYNNSNEYNGTIGAGTTGNGIKKACDYYGYKLITLSSKEELEEALKSGHTVYASMGPGIFTNPGYTHAVLFNGYSNGSTYAYDPKHPNRVGWHNISTIYNQKSRDKDDAYNGAVFFMIFK